MKPFPPHRARLSMDEALLIWRARDVHRVQSCFVGLVLLVMVMELCTFVMLGYWYIGLLLVVVQWGIWRALRWGLRWIGQRLACWLSQHTTRRQRPYALPH